MSTARPAPGTFFFVVGPSGAGKDTLIDAARVALSGQSYAFARRVITRPAGSAGEDHEPETTEGFARRRTAGEFLVSWQAHGLDYGLPVSLLTLLASGSHVVANGSRAMVGPLAQRLPSMVVIEVTAPPEVLAHRIAARGRETADQVLERLARQVDPLPSNLLRHRVANDGEPALGIQRFLCALGAPASLRVAREIAIDTGDDAVAWVPHCGWSAGTRVRVQGPTGRLADVRLHVYPAMAGQSSWPDAPALRQDEMALPARLMRKLELQDGQALRALPILAPSSHSALVRKLRGETLSASDYESVLIDAIDGRYDTTDLTAFLVETSRRLEEDSRQATGNITETLALARARSRLVPSIRWDEQRVVDKHSMGGVPGSRITLIVTPIVAAHGMAMPKASSRAITSASGTAEAMAVLANVDLDAPMVQRCVRQARACIAWNGYISHSVVDDVMNRITRPLGLQTGAWSVASILSKKKAAGVTHLVVDVPYGPRAKQATRQEAERLCRLFEHVGDGLGLHVKAIATDGSRPIGRGIGPVLETRDALQVLDNAVDCPLDLRAKALQFAARILAWDPEIGDEIRGLARAQELLQSGAAMAALERIVETQGRRHDPPYPTRFTHTVKAERAGVITELDGWQIAGLARDAGAPACEGAGIDLLCTVGQQVAPGQALYRVHAADEATLSGIEASLRARPALGITMAPLP